MSKKRHKHRHIEYGEFECPEEKRESVKESTRTNVHHILNKCRSDEYNVNDARNLIELKVDFHNAIHRLFENRTPQEIVVLMKGIVQGTLSKETLALFMELCRMDRRDFYKDGLVK